MQIPRVYGVYDGMVRPRARRADASQWPSGARSGAARAEAAKDLEAVLGAIRRVRLGCVVVAEELAVQSRPVLAASEKHLVAHGEQALEAQDGRRRRRLRHNGANSRNQLLGGRRRRRLEGANSLGELLRGHRRPRHLSGLHPHTRACTHVARAYPRQGAGRTRQRPQARHTHHRTPRRGRNVPPSRWNRAPGVPRGEHGHWPIRRGARLRAATVGSAARTARALRRGCGTRRAGTVLPSYGEAGAVPMAPYTPAAGTAGTTVSSEDGNNFRHVKAQDAPSVWSLGSLRARPHCGCPRLPSPTAPTSLGISTSTGASTRTRTARDPV
jgi:hypothetical protein